MNPIQLIPYSVHNAASNMAHDEFMFRTEGTFLRLYGWRPSALSFGRNQSRFSDIDLDFCENNGIDTVKRLTGGRTVLHQNEFTYSFTADVEIFSNSVLETYRQISKPILAFLQQLGLSPEMNKRSENRSRSSICFKQTSAYELTINGKKLVGSAQFRNSKRFLQHGSILLDIDWELWGQIWGSKKDQTGLQERVTCLRAELGTLPALEKLTDILVSQFQAYFQTDMQIFEFDAKQLKAIETYTLNYTSWS